MLKIVKNQSTKIDIEALRELVADDVNAVDQLIRERLAMWP
jgi:hypothetical protein